MTKIQIRGFTTFLSWSNFISQSVGEESQNNVSVTYKMPPPKYESMVDELTLF